MNHPKSELVLRNRQRTRPVNLRQLETLARDLLARSFPRRPVALGIHLVAAPEMTRLNQQFLRHAGSTDVITFDYAEPGAEGWSGEILICVDDAVAQARRFRTTWPSEVARYLIHGLLHLQGYDDRRAAARRRMKRAENRLLREVARRFPLQGLARRPRPAGGGLPR